SKTSVFGTASLDLREKPGPLTGFSKSLFQNRARLAHSQLVLEQAQYTKQPCWAIEPGVTGDRWT
ncbi:MAG: hypothetical protein LBT00_11465, partial [Spirochaetaceae bacterium]|nr:hypothetical protein [Spirochaetaceae bacterium]